MKQVKQCLCRGYDLRHCGQNLRLFFGDIFGQGFGLRFGRSLVKVKPYTWVL